MDNKITIRKWYTPYILLIPVSFILFVFILYPIIKSVYMSLTNWDFSKIADGHHWVGLKNFIAVFRLPQFFPSLWITVLYSFFVVVGRMLIGLFLALLMNESFREKGIFRAAVIIPWAIPGIVTCISFVLILNPLIGIANATLINLGLISKPILFLENPAWAFFSIAYVAIWVGTPFVAITLLAGLQSISVEMEQMAMIDGCSWSRRLVSITLPLLMPVWFVVLLLQVIWTLREFGLIYLMTKGGPGFSTSVLSIDMYYNAFKYYKMGISSAEGIILLSISLLFAIVYTRVLKRESL